MQDLTPTLPPDELLVRLRRLIAWSVAAENGVGRKATFGLTRREHEVLQLLAGGFDQNEIARALVISPRTVETHIQHILPKLGVRRRAQAVAVAYQQGLVESREHARS